jgi:8-oxo-dGTP pyrophosphatase MutT (NUDIX family)
VELSALRRRLAGITAPPEAIGALATADDAADLLDQPLRLAAVLVPIVHGEAPGILLTHRAANLTAHAGQVSFPGGRIEPDDASPEQAALREAQEEIGLDPSDVELAGRLPDYVTGTGFLITPILGLLPDGLVLTPSPGEVAEIFTLPMTTLLDPAAPEQRTRMFRGRERHFWVWPHERHYIWGATAAILVHLAARLRAQAA